MRSRHIPSRAALIAACLLAVPFPAAALQPGLMFSSGSISPLTYGPAVSPQSFTTGGLSLSHRIWFAEPYADARFGKISANGYNTDAGHLGSFAVGLRGLVPVFSTGLETGLALGVAWDHFAEDKVYGGDGIGKAPAMHREPVTGVYLGWKNRLYAQVDAYPRSSSAIPWTLRLGINPFAWLPSRITFRGHDNRRPED